LLEDLADKPEHIRNQADVIRLAGERAAELTHRLLAFARRQPLNPQRTDVNQLVQEAQKLLSRTVGEHIHIELVCSADLWVAIVDPHELQNAILNLAINSRDAMPEGGRLTIETANMAIDADYAQAHNILPGQYVMIAVSDTGEGMTADVADKAFDPFFTTKPEGQGSGLGLAMVHGFVHQSGGFAKIYSEPGQGTTVRLYLPRVLGSAYERDGQMETDSKEIAGGNERILLVEDDPLVRRYAVDSLSRLGYQVTECVDGEQALVTLEEGAHYHMLLTDVVLAGGVSGKQVAAAAMESDPQMKILFMSGYAENAIVHHGRLDRGVNLISKPFRAAELARRVRGLLDAKGRSGATVDA
jgi:CheY-like chemotaxis protein